MRNQVRRTEQNPAGGETFTAQNSVEIRVRGRWVMVPAVDVDSKKLIAAGRWLRTARVRSEEMMVNELENPGPKRVFAGDEVDDWLRVSPRIVQH